MIEPHAKLLNTADKQRVWPVVLSNILLVLVICAGVFAGLCYYTVTMLRAKISCEATKISLCTQTVDQAITENLYRAEGYAKLLWENCFAHAPASGIAQYLLSLQPLFHDGDIGFIASDGSVTSTAHLISDRQSRDLYERVKFHGTSVMGLNMNNAGLVFGAPVSASGKDAGVLYIVDLDAVNSESVIKAASIGMLSYLIIDENNRVVSPIGTIPDDFDYAAVSASGLLFKNGRIPSVEPYFRNGNLFSDMPATADWDVMPAQTTLSAISDRYLTFTAWYENDLSVKGWRTVAQCVQQFDELTLQESLLILLGSMVLILLSVIFSISSTISRVTHNRRLNQAMLFDPITGGNNFQYFKYAAEKTMRNRRYFGKIMVLVALDVDKFRVFSDIYGYKQGELLLLDIFNYISRNLKKGELISRFAVDQFSVLMIVPPDEPPLERVIQLQKGISRLNPKNRTTCTAGIYIVSDRKQSVERMFSFAGFAKDAARRTAGASVQLFDNAMRDRLLRVQRLESLMDKALKNDEFVIYLQPKYTVQTHLLSGAEALVRWNSPELGFIGPGDFIPLFEENGFIKQLDDYVVTGVCRIQQKWIRQGKELFPISVNISRVNFADKDVAYRIHSIVDAHGIPPSMIELELTESAFFDDKRTFISTVNLLKDFGFPVSIDDFGSGYSSLNSLKDLPLDVVKLDKEFFDTTSGETDRSAVLILNTIALAKNLNMMVVAEGIETKEQVDFLTGTGCDLIQGYYFSKPLPLNEFEELDVYRP